MGSSRGGRAAHQVACVTIVAALLTAGCRPSPPQPSAVATAPSTSPAATAAPPSATSSPATEATRGNAAPTAAPTAPPTAAPLANPVYEEFAVAAGDQPHDIAPAPDGRVWYTAQHAGAIGLLDPSTGEVARVDLGGGSAPHGVIADDAGHAWVTDGGLNAIVRVDLGTLAAETFPLPDTANANLNTATFAGDGQLWFTGQAGVYGRLDPATGTMEVFDAPRGRGPYGIATTAEGTVWFSSLAGSYIARIAGADGTLEVVDVPTPGGGARRVWPDSTGGLWVTEWFAGNLARYDPADGTWRRWPLPGGGGQPYAVYVDEDDTVWVTDFATDALMAFDPASEQFRSFPYPTPGAQVRQLLGRPGEIWGAGSGTDTILVLRTR